MKTRWTVFVLLGLFCSGFSSLTFAGDASSPVVASSHLIRAEKKLISPGARLLAAYTFEDESGQPDPQEWTSKDLSAQTGIYFHVDDFSGLDPDYAPLSGSQSLWCGQREPLPDYPSDQTTPGYGNNWWQCFDSAVYSTPSPVTLSYTLSYDLESNYDFLYVEYLGAGDTDWNILKTYTGTDGPLSDSVSVSAAAHGTEIRFRFRVLTFEGGSDEDGMYDSHGAVILDDILITSGVYTLSSENFESETVGDTATTSGAWTATIAAGLGDFVGVQSGSEIVQEDPVTTNSSGVLHFFSGSPDTYACGGYPEQAAVPLPQPIPGYSFLGYHGYKGIDNRAVSPWIPISLSGQNVTPDFINLKLDVYEDMPSESAISYSLSLRFSGDGLSPWRTDNIFYSNGQMEWVTLNPWGDFPVPEGATAVQVSLRVKSMDREPYPPDCQTHAPLFDNVEIYGIYEDELVVTNTLDSGPGSLREAILAANAAPGTNVIFFDIPPAELGPIRPETALPEITEPVVINGYSQPGAAGGPGYGWEEMAPVIELDGSLIGEGNGLTLSADATVTGLVIHGFTTGIWSEFARVYITHNFFGTDVNGSTAATNTSGLRINHADGGAVSYNLISGAHGAIGGLRPFSCSNMLISHNRIGTDRTGTYAIANDTGALLLHCEGMMIRDNLISGNTNHGLSLYNTTSSTIQGNLIGVDVSGALPLGNAWNGIRIDDGSHSNEIGGPMDSPLQNTIAYNGIGILCKGEPESYNHVWGNRIYSNTTSPFYIGDPDLGTYEGLRMPPFAVRNVASDSYTVFTLAEYLGDPNDNAEAYIFSSDAIGVPGETWGGTGQSEFFEASLPLEFVSLVGKADFWVFSWPDADLWLDGLPAGKYLSMIVYNVDSGRTTSFTNIAEVLNTPVGTDVLVAPQDSQSGTYPLSLSYAEVTEAGNTWLTTSSTGPALPSCYQAVGSAAFHDLSTDATHTGDITLCIRYDETEVADEEGLRLLQYDETLDPPDYVDLDAVVDTENNTICGTTTSLSTFVLAWLDPGGFIVTNTLDAGPGSLRDAILAANASPDTNVIYFDIHVSELGPIVPETFLPDITEPIVIDGYSQQGATGGEGYGWDEISPVIEIDGSQLAGGFGLTLSADATVTGLVIHDFSTGIRAIGARVHISQNFIGTDAAGASSYPSGAGIQLNGCPGSVVSSNLVAGSSGFGLYPTLCSRMEIRDNRIGTDRSGLASLPNGTGAYVSDCDSMLIQDNLISSNQGHGLVLYGSSYNAITGNRIGVGADGAEPMGNATCGIWLNEGSQYNEIGGPMDSPLQNTIAFNTYGILCPTQIESYNHVWGNRIFSNTTSPFIIGNPSTGPYEGLPMPPFAVRNVASDSYTVWTIASYLGDMNDDVEAYIFSSDGIGVPSETGGTGQSELFEAMLPLECVSLVGKEDFWVFSWPDADLWVDGLPTGRYLSMIVYNKTRGRTTSFSNIAEVLNTPVGIDVLVVPQDPESGTYPLSVSYAQVTGAGNTWLTASDTGPALPPGFRMVGAMIYYDLTTDAAYTGDITICLDYDDTGMLYEEELLLLHYDQTLSPPAYVDLEAVVDTENNTICGTASSLSPFVLAIDDPASDAGPPPAALRYALMPAVPNPFNPSTVLRFELAKPQWTSLVIYDLAGRQVRTLIVGELLEAGSHSRQWNGRDNAGGQVSSGVYFYRLDAGPFSQTLKMTLIK